MGTTRIDATGMHADDLVNEYRAAVAEWTRQHAVYSATQPGTADASGAEEDLHRIILTALDLEDELRGRLGSPR